MRIRGRGRRWPNRDALGLRRAADAAAMTLHAVPATPPRRRDGSGQQSRIAPMRVATRMRRVRDSLSLPWFPMPLLSSFPREAPRAHYEGSVPNWAVRFRNEPITKLNGFAGSGSSVGGAGRRPSDLAFRTLRAPRCPQRASERPRLLDGVPSEDAGTFIRAVAVGVELELYRGRAERGDAQVRP